MCIRKYNNNRLFNKEEAFKLIKAFRVTFHIIMQNNDKINERRK